MGLALASSLFLGCQQFLGDSSKEDGKNLNKPPEDVALTLSVKQTPECAALREKVAAARAEGKAPGDLESGFIRDCIEEVKASDARKDIVLPPDLVPDPLTRCRWIVAQIDGGHDELIIKFKYWCPDDCDSMARIDTIDHGKYCRDPKPDCEEFRKKLATMDPNSEEYARLKRFLAENCGVKPPLDTIPKPITYCDSLKRRLMAGFFGPDELERIHRQLAERCNGDSILPPKPVGYCDSLRRLMNSGHLTSEDSIRIMRQLTEKCGVKPPIIPPVNCDSLRRQLAGMDTTTAEFLKLRSYYLMKCPQDPPKPPTLCDSIRKVLPTIDTNGRDTSWKWMRRYLAEHCGGPALPLTCEQIKAKMANLDPGSADYTRLKTMYGEKCIQITPVTSDCDAYRAKLANVSPDSPDYAYLKNLIAEKCRDIKQ